MAILSKLLEHTLYTKGTQQLGFKVAGTNILSKYVQWHDFINNSQLLPIRAAIATSLELDFQMSRLVHGFYVTRDMVPRRSRGATSCWNEEKPWNNLLLYIHFCILVEVSFHIATYYIGTLLHLLSRIVRCVGSGIDEIRGGGGGG